MRTESQSSTGPRSRALTTALLFVCLLGFAGARPLAASSPHHQGKDLVAGRMVSTGSSFATRVADADAVFPERGSVLAVATDTVAGAAPRVLAGVSVDDRPIRGPPQDLR